MQAFNFIQFAWRLVAAGLFSVSLLPPQITPIPTPTIAGASSNWSQPTFVTYGWFPDIAADAAGGLHLVWSDEKVIGDTGLTATPPASGFDVVMYSTSQDGTSWSTPNDIAASPTEGAVTRPAIFIDQKGILHMGYRSEKSIFYTQAPLAEAATAQGWSPSILINELQVGYYSRVVEDSKGVLHMVYTENVISARCPICYHLFYRQSVDNGKTWSLRYDISRVDSGAVKPQILIDKEDNIHVVWEAGAGGALGQLTDPTTAMYSGSHDGGKTWSQPYKFPAPNGLGKNPTIGLDGRGNLVVAWLGLNEDLVYYQASRDHGKTWSDPVVISDVWGGWTNYNSRLDDYSMATDSAGNIHLVFVGRMSADDKNLEVIHLTWDGSSWSKPEAITVLSGDVPEWPRLAISLGNQLNVVWFVRDQAHIWDTSNSHYKIWYSQEILPINGVKPQPYPSATLDPNRGNTPTPNVTPAPTKVPPDVAAALSSPESTFDVYSEKDDMLMMAKSLAPGVLLLGLVFFVIRSRRH